MPEENFRYYPLSKDELNSAWIKHKALIEGFLSKNRLDCNNVYLDSNSLISVISKVDQRRKYFEYFHRLDMSELKEVSLIAFWYIKLHPLCLGPRDFTNNHPPQYESLNEKLALYSILSTLRVMLKAKHMPVRPLDNLPREYLSEIIYSFTYRDISKESMILLVESIAAFLGLNPYSKGSGTPCSEKAD